MHDPIPVYYRAALTGRTRYRVGFRKVLVLQVEERWVESLRLRDTGKVKFYWRDARLGDFHPMTWELKLPTDSAAEPAHG